ncbi:methylase [Pimelobacter simplex]|uniref:Methylase n=1 Tax=Nocardioides simplex TaxID=2045 RepID=A0A7J5E491_NOCSI|nr:methylase [Pimelobacter simplex]KAB2813096.1 methylase [Pimelobacter simplex]
MKSRHRVKTYGEVFTPLHMVNRMLDLVRDELETGPDFVDKTFLEPSAGDGNFLVAILRRKLHAIENRYAEDMWVRQSLFAVASIYGIELLEDNHEEAKELLLAELVAFHSSHALACSPETDAHRAASYLIDTNIVRGNMLTGQTPEGQDIQLSWWHRIHGKPDMVQRQPFTLASLRENSGFDFTEYETYRVCRIDKVHEEIRAGG